jgi:hypothetical protein
MWKYIQVKYPLLFWMLMKTEISRQILKKSQIPNFMEVLPVGAELFHLDQQTDGRMDGQLWRNE